MRAAYRLLYGRPATDAELNAGAAFLYSTNDVLVTTFTKPAPEFGERFGTAVAAQGDRVLISAPYVDIGAQDSGAAYLFNTNGVLLTTFTNPTPADFDYFGTAQLKFCASLVFPLPL